jgi:hypothetical protein
MDSVPTILDQLFSLLPVELHDKVREIYTITPGTLVKYLNPNTMVKKVKCENEFLTDGKIIELDDAEYLNDVSQNHRDSAQETRKYKNDEIKYQRHSNQHMSHERTEPRTPENVDHMWSEARAMPISPVRNYDFLYDHLYQSLQQKFYEQQIMEINLEDIVKKILDKYQQQNLLFDKHRKDASTKIQFDERFLGKTDFKKINIDLSVDAYIICKPQPSMYGLRDRNRIQTNYSVILQFNETSYDTEKLNNFIHLLENNNVSTVIQILQENTNLTWENFGKKS